MTGSGCVAALSVQSVGTFAHYAGVVFGYNQSVVRVWAPTLDTRIGDGCQGRIFHTSDGFAGTSGVAIQFASGVVKVRNRPFLFTQRE